MGALKGTKSAGLISDDIFCILPTTSRIWFHLSTFLFFISSKYGTIALSSSRKPHPFCLEWRKDMMENTHYWWSPKSNRKWQTFEISYKLTIWVQRRRSIIVLKLCFTVIDRYLTINIHSCLDKMGSKIQNGMTATKFTWFLVFLCMDWLEWGIA